jgi:cellulose synthase/poly-beta-1,6-N-acetylglucosamine synthase-like glycosyltransferase
LTFLVSIVVILLLVQGVLSLAEGMGFARFVRDSLGAPLSGPTPMSSIVAPIKWPEPGLRDNIKQLFSQNYPAYELIFVIADSDDAARSAIEEAIAQNPDRKARLLIAGPAAGRGEKVNNLLHGVAAADSFSEILAFVDSDARVTTDWLRALVAALEDPGVGASTGYRWYVPATGGFWSMLVSAWNGSIATTLGSDRRSFAWGGSSAIRRETFNRIGVANRWENALSDDYALTRAVRQAGLRIAFVPRCLLLTREDFGLGSALEFTRRQVTITRVYDPSAWWIGLVSQSLFVLGFFGGIGCATNSVSAGTIGQWGLGMMGSAAHSPPAKFIGSLWTVSLIVSLLAIYVLGSAKSWLRLRAVTLMLPEARPALRRMRIVFYVLWPVVSLLFLYDFAASAFTRTIKWRGVKYQMRSRTETVVLDEKR